MRNQPLVLEVFNLHSGLRAGSIRSGTTSIGHRPQPTPTPPTTHPPTHSPQKNCKIKDTNHPIKRTADINRVELRNRLILPKLPSLTTEFQPNVCLHSPDHVILDLDRKAAVAPLSDFALFSGRYAGISVLGG